MTEKLGRKYSLTINPRKGDTSSTITTITLPFTIQIDIQRDMLMASNYCQLRVYNLGREKRDKLYFNISSYIGVFQTMEINAGYGDGELASIFTGNLTECWSVREGTNFITYIESNDGGYGFTDKADYIGNFGPPQTYTDVIRTIMRYLEPEVAFGGIGVFPQPVTKKVTLSGNPYTILFELTNHGFFIDNGKSYAMNIKDYIPDGSVQDIPSIDIDLSTGLLNTPKFEETILTLETLFEPQLKPGRLVTIKSKDFPKADGTYITRSVAHRGIISESVSGSLITSASFFKFNTGIAAPINVGR